MPHEAKVGAGENLRRAQAWSSVHRAKIPRLSARGKELRDLRRIVKKRSTAASTRDLLSDQDSSEDDIDEYWIMEYESVEAKRYVNRPLNYRRRADRWKALLYDHRELNDTEVQEHFRLQRDMFFRLVSLVQDDPIFVPSGSKPFRGGVELHLLLGGLLGIATGSVHNYLYRASKAVIKLEASTLMWPDPAELKFIAQRIKDKYWFVNCVRVTDGTQFPLASKTRHHGEEYYRSKGSYSVNALITCDDVARVRDIVVGWPGSVHDNRVRVNSALVLRPQDHFSHNEYVLGDSAFQASSHMIPAFKKPPKAQMHHDKKYFNTKLAKVRIKSELCIGLMKMRFRYLNSGEISKTRRHMRRLIRYVTCSCVLHNLLIAEPIPPKWQRDLQRLMTGQLEDDDELNAPIPENAKGDERRNQRLVYLLEVRK
ncbi:LOW QUALITY PROTEIN: hypothetical protein PHMEG_00016769 [Phytophthora megakarya]|uniref:DDE Tnp4 domain-containing protein n=1 Tax=Phytophthora megakarya TaxID=4795 RepID=A0A225VXX8_9STRA|nr:LOW QUALITY PROTEIN: hypothetical protein PHMEG_00016769 [Phytophthora megakarya]